MSNAFSINIFWPTWLKKQQSPNELELKLCNLARLQAQHACIASIKQKHNNPAVDAVLDQYGAAVYKAIDSSNPEEIAGLLRKPDMRLAFLLLAENPSNAKKLSAADKDNSFWWGLLKQPAVTGASQPVPAAGRSMMHFLSICADNIKTNQPGLNPVVTLLQVKYALQHLQKMNLDIKSYLQSCIRQLIQTPHTTTFDDKKAAETRHVFQHAGNLYKRWLDAHAKEQDATPSSEIKKAQADIAAFKQHTSLFNNAVAAHNALAASAYEVPGTCSAPAA
jgi:hypothetical protein